MEFELPAGWYCLDLQQAGSAEILDSLISPGSPTPQVIDALCAANVRLALVRPGRPAITGAVIVAPPLGLTAAEIFRMYDESGEAVALGNLDGLPVISIVRHAHADIALVQVIYLICAQAATTTLTFAAAATPNAESAVGEVAHVVSGARVVRSKCGCPV